MTTSDHPHHPAPARGETEPPTDRELLDALAFAGPGVFVRLARRYNWERATPTFVRAAIAAEMPYFALLKARKVAAATPTGAPSDG